VPLGIPVNIDGVWITYFPVFGILRRIYYSPLLKKALLNNISDFDFLHLHSIFLWPTYIASRIAFLANKPYAISLRGMLVKDLFKRKNYIIKNIWLFLFERICLMKAEFIHVTSNLEKQEALKFNLPIKSFMILPNGVSNFDDEYVNGKNLECINPNLYLDNLDNLSPFILFVGRINWKKGLDRLVQSLSFVDKNINLLIAGNDEENYSANLMALIYKHHLQNRIFFIGEVRGKIKSNLYKAAKLLVLPSYSENFGNVVIEALYMGCPVGITKDVGLHDELIRNGVVISLPDNYEEMGRCIQKSIRDEIFLKKIGQDGCVFVRNEFSWIQIASKMERTYLNSMRIY
jgi:glycosyltransferase involved in cell wall biosynthesis